MCTTVLMNRERSLAHPLEFLSLPVVVSVAFEIQNVLSNMQLLGTAVIIILCPPFLFFFVNIVSVNVSSLLYSPLATGDIIMRILNHLFFIIYIYKSSNTHTYTHKSLFITANITFFFLFFTFSTHTVSLI